MPIYRQEVTEDLSVSKHLFSTKHILTARKPLEVKSCRSWSHISMASQKFLNNFIHILSWMFTLEPFFYFSPLYCFLREQKTHSTGPGHTWIHSDYSWLSPSTWGIFVGFSHFAVLIKTTDFRKSSLKSKIICVNIYVQSKNFEIPFHCSCVLLMKSYEEINCL